MNLSAKEISIDKLVADQLGGDPFIKKMMEAARNGHLCVKGNLEGENVEELFGEEEWFDKPIGKWGDLVYFQRCWVLETRVVRELKRLMMARVAPMQIERSDHLNEAQLEAVTKGLKSPVFCLSGGPGTGKTHTIIELVRQFEQRGGRVIVGAPTGKAVAGLKSRLPNIECKTLHDMLRIKGTIDLFYGKKELSEDMVIVDESSMIDIGMWGALLRAVKTNTRLILVGDHHQLPPIEAGTVYGEICDWMREKERENYVYLNKCMRSDQSEILEMAEKVKRGETIEAKNLNQRLDLKKWKKCFPAPTHTEINIQELLRNAKKFRILSCLRRGPFGVETLNQQLIEYFRRDFQKGDVWPIPIMITKTSHQLGVYNGEMGILLKHSPSLTLEKEDTVYFEQERFVAAPLLPGFEWAYAISVHKSQGSEYDRVVFIVPEGAEVFGREILYTGITRARLSLEVYGNRETLNLCLSKAMERRSGIRRKLAC